MYLFCIENILCTVQILFLKHWIKKEKVWILFRTFLFSIESKEYSVEELLKFIFFL